MDILNVSQHYARTVYHVRLTDAEAAMEDYELVNLADARGDPERAREVYNFGGKVERMLDGTHEIHVYID